MYKAAAFGYNSVIKSKYKDGQRQMLNQIKKVACGGCLNPVYLQKQEKDMILPILA